ncbi:hypothetical protein IAU59_004165 [Kwoniella sp. CBS 9459]
MPIPRVHISNRPFDLAYRLSTPSHLDYATDIDPSFPTILFVHPIWTDSFFFYPQYEDPLFYENYNLLAFDMPAHGSSVVHSKLEEYTWTAYAKTLIEALQILDVRSVHVVGASMGCTATIQMASSSPNLVESITLVSPPAFNEPPERTMAYKDVQALIDAALGNQDGESLDLLAKVNFDYSTAQMHDPVIREIHDGYVQLGRCMIADGSLEADQALPLYTSLMSSRAQFVQPDNPNLLECSILVLQGTSEGWASDDYDWEHLVARHNDRREQNGESRNGTRIVLEGMSRWMTLTAPDVLNPPIHKFISRKPHSSSVPLVPVIPPVPSLARRPTRPRYQDIDSPALDSSLRPDPRPDSNQVRRKSNDGSVNVNIEVEVLVKVDEGQ